MGKNRGKNKKVWFMAGETVYPFSHTSPVQVGKPHQHPYPFQAEYKKGKEKGKRKQKQGKLIGKRKRHRKYLLTIHE